LVLDSIPQSSFTLLSSSINHLPIIISS
jgi:hypothetical protein